MKLSVFRTKLPIKQGEEKRMMNPKLLRLGFVCMFVCGVRGVSAAQENMTPEQPAAVKATALPPAGTFVPQGKVITPPSSISRPGKGVHTNFKIFIPAGQQGVSSGIPSYTFAETP